MAIDLQAAVNMTVTRMLDGAGLEGVPGWRTIVLNVEDDRESAQLVCPDHGVVIADLDSSLVITAEYECVECEILACSECTPHRHRLCSEHLALVTSP